MFVSQKCQYAIRAIFELAKHYGEGPVKIANIAEAQGIPPRFLEVILGELKQGGYVESRRGSAGGYMLSQEPSSVTVGDIVRFEEGPLGPVECVSNGADESCPVHENCVFLPLWTEVRDAMSDVYDTTTFEDLVEKERRMQDEYVPQYAI